MALTKAERDEMDAIKKEADAELASGKAKSSRTKKTYDFDTDEPIAKKSTEKAEKADTSSTNNATEDKTETTNEVADTSSSNDATDSSKVSTSLESYLDGGSSVDEGEGISDALQAYVDENDSNPLLDDQETVSNYIKAYEANDNTGGVEEPESNVDVYTSEYEDSDNASAKAAQEATTSSIKSKISGGKVSDSTTADESIEEEDYTVNPVSYNLKGAATRSYKKSKDSPLTSDTKILSADDATGISEGSPLALLENENQVLDEQGDGEIGPLQTGEAEVVDSEGNVVSDDYSISKKVNPNKIDDEELKTAKIGGADGKIYEGESGGEEVDEQRIGEQNDPEAQAYADSSTSFGGYNRGMGETSSTDVQSDERIKKFVKSLYGSDPVLRAWGAKVMKMKKGNK